jgi:hypothetical protein
VVAALREVQVPCIVHDGLPDLLQLCDKFVGHVPDNPVELGKLVSKIFPIVFDTCLQFQELHQVKQGKGCHGVVSLEEVQRDLAARRMQLGQSLTKEFGLYTHRASSSKNGAVFGRGIGASARDAMSIADAFITDMSCRIRRGTLPEISAGSKRPRDFDDSGMSTPKKMRKKSNMEKTKDASAEKLEHSPCKERREGELSKQAEPEAVIQLWPSFLRSHIACSQFHNRVAATGVPYLDLQHETPVDQPVDVGMQLRRLLCKLGAAVDSHGRPVVTRAMTKQLRRALVQIKGQSKSSQGEIIEPGSS